MFEPRRCFIGNIVLLAISLSMYMMNGENTNYYMGHEFYCAIKQDVDKACRGW